MLRSDIVIGSFILPVSLLQALRSISALQAVSYSRWSVYTALLTLVGWKSLKSKNLSRTGVIAALLLGLALLLASDVYFILMLTFFVAGSAATKFGSRTKRLLESDFDRKSQRTWIQVLANGGSAGVLALTHLARYGPQFLDVQFGKDAITPGSSSYLHVAILGAIACATSDTFASELPPACAVTQHPRLITNLARKVPIGTNGGVTMCGFWCSIFGGGLIGLMDVLCLTLITGHQNSNYGERLSYYWPLVLLGCIGGLFGSLLDSCIGASMQFSGIDSESKSITEEPGTAVKHISGIAILDNHLVNFVSTSCTALFLPFVAGHCF